MKNFFTKWTISKATAKRDSKTPVQLLREERERERERKERMSTVQLPTVLVSKIVGLMNASFNNDPLIVKINPETGKQVAVSNPVLVARLTKSVLTAAKLLKQQRRYFKLVHRELNDLDPEDGEEFVEAIEELAAADPDIDELVQEAALKYFGVHEDEDDVPISKAFYLVAFDIANQLSALSLKMRRRYLTKVIKTIHAKNPELDFGLFQFICHYTQDHRLKSKVRPYLPEWVIAEAKADAAHPTFRFAYETISAYERGDSLNVFKWANRSEKYRKRWLSVVSGEQSEKRGSSEKRRSSEEVDKFVETWTARYTHETLLSMISEFQKKNSP